MKHFIVGLGVLFIVACSDNKKPEPEEILEYQLESYKKAHQVESMVLERVDQQKEELDKDLQ